MKQLHSHLDNHVENNPRIASFMGLTKEYSYLKGGIIYKRGDFSMYSADELRYHESFDWIIPVAQEIIYKYESHSVEFDEQYKKNPYDKKHIYRCVVGFLDYLGYW